MNNCYGIKYTIKGIYGEVEHCTVISELDETFRTYTLNRVNNNMPEVMFDVTIKDVDSGNNVYEKNDIIGLPVYLNLDMGTYYRMVKLKELRRNNLNINNINFDINDISEKVIKAITEKLKESDVSRTINR